MVVRFAVRLVPRGGVDRIDGIVDGALRVRVAAPPVGGAANEALLRLVADALDLPRSRLQLAAGASSRRKVIQVDGLDPAVLRSRWPGLDV